MVMTDTLNSFCEYLAGWLDAAGRENPKLDYAEEIKQALRAFTYTQATETEWTLENQIV